MAHCKYCKQEMCIGGPAHRCEEQAAAATEELMARRSAADCSLSSECVIGRDLEGRLKIQSAPEIFLCARGSIEDLITRHNDLIRERDEWKAIAKDALASFRCTQRPEIYPEGHWSRRAQSLLENH